MATLVRNFATKNFQKPPNLVTLDPTWTYSFSLPFARVNSPLTAKPISEILWQHNSIRIHYLAAEAAASSVESENRLFSFRKPVFLLSKSRLLDKYVLRVTFDIKLVHSQRDQIGRFFGLWTTFQSLRPQLICPNLLHSKAIFVKVSKSSIFLVKSCWATFIDIWQFFTGHTVHSWEQNHYWVWPPAKCVHAYFCSLGTRVSLPPRVELCLYPIVAIVGTTWSVWPDGLIIFQHLAICKNENFPNRILQNLPK